jgi:hypothetical protein
LSAAAFLLIEERADGIFLFRYDRRGQCVGDTWHASPQDAKDQALYEYPGRVISWEEVPTTVGDAIRFGLEEISGEAGA